MHPQPRVRFVVLVCTRVFTAEAPDTSGIPHAMVLTAYPALSPGTGLFCPRHFRGNCFPRKLSASVGAPGPHGFAVRFERRSSCVAKASTASRPTFVTTRTPLLSRRDGVNNTQFLIFGKRNIFAQGAGQENLKTTRRANHLAFATPVVITRACGRSSKHCCPCLIREAADY
jgi:hypothetical protein